MSAPSPTGDKTAEALAGTTGAGQAARLTGRRRLSPAVVLLIVAGALVAVSAVRALTGAQDVTSPGQIAGALTMAVPIGLAGLGGLWAERAGVVNIGLEGMMILGTFFGAWAGWQTSPWLGVLAGMVGGALGGLVHAFVTVTIGVDHIVSGVAINILALGATQYLAKLVFADKPAGSPKQSPPIDDIGSVSLPWVSDWLDKVAAHHWFLVSDVAGILGGLTTDVSLLTLLAVALLIGTFFALWKTAFGLRLRSCGENPTAAESLGVNVYRYKYLAVIASGALAGLGGVFIAMVPSHIYNEGQTGGRGYIGLAAMIFGNWRPGGLAMGAGLFGYTDSLQLRNGGPSVHALLLLVAVLLLVIALWRAYRRRWTAAVVSAVAGAGLLVWYATTDTVPIEFVGATPYVATLLVLSLASQRLRMPKADGLVYRRGQGK
ncbi:ABC transporter permease [Streptomyces sp. NPDC001380]|uniref:ABC transporter permease n=1 Tax=Streptomyces sp. NPDC001380 TaxID=3364566 RepID=UPI0036C404E6